LKKQTGKRRAQRMALGACFAFVGQEKTGQNRKK
jgi:hypothetical protein